MENRNDKGVWKEGDLTFDKIVWNGKVVKEEKRIEKPKKQKKEEQKDE